MDFAINRGGVYKDLIIHSDRIISSIGYRGICSIEMDDSGSPYETAHFQTPAMGISIAHDESYLYFTTYNVAKTFLHTLAYNNGELTEISRFEFEGIPYTDMCVQNNLIFIFINDTLKIVDVSDPFLRSCFSFGHTPRERHFVVENNLLYATEYMTTFKSTRKKKDNYLAFTWYPEEIRRYVYTTRV